MAWKVEYSDPEVTTRAGFGKVAHLPFIMDSRPGYYRLGSRYLIDRGLAEWDPVQRGNGPRSTPPTDQTMKNYADWLVNFLEWAEIRGIDLMTCGYTEHIHQRYQMEMLKGIWSRDGAPLSPTTVNVRVQQACDFLTWMADKGIRERFDIATEVVQVKTRKATSSTGHRMQDKVVRKGKVKLKKRKLRIPTDEKLGAWLDRVYKKHGETMGLMCEMVLLSAMRREEVASLRVDTLPEHRADWHIDDAAKPKDQQRVLLTIRYGAKGRDYGTDHGDKIGPARDLWIPLVFAERLDAYRKTKTGRTAALRRWVKAATNVAEQRRRIADAVHLFLNEETGERLTSNQLYHAWTSVELPYKGWSPHLGRDWWACTTLWREVNKGVDDDTPHALEAMGSHAMMVIRLIIKPQLGHADENTTMIYLQWFMDMIGSGLSINYEASLPDVEFGSPGADV
jgi:integrase